MLLAIDCSGPQVAVCAGHTRERLECRSVSASLNHNEILARCVWDVLGSLDETASTRVAVNVGPGTFTGTRVGVSFAVGLAQGWGVSVIPVTSFKLAIGMAPHKATRVAVAMPVVRDLWCRAFLVRHDVEWEEGDLQELSSTDVSGGLDGAPLLVPWGEIPGAIMPPADWSPARELWKLARDSNRTAESDPAQVRVRYVGPSQAERNFRDRQNAVRNSNRQR